MNGADAARAVAGERIRALIGGFLPAWFDGSLADDVALGSAGLGLDSVAVVELLIACEESFGVSFPDSLLEARLTIGRLAAHLAEATGAGPGSPS